MKRKDLVIDLMVKTATSPHLKGKCQEDPIELVNTATSYVHSYFMDMVLKEA